MARSIAETATDVLTRRSALAGIPVSDEAIGLYLWHERGFRDHDPLVQLINHTRRLLDERPLLRPAVPSYRRPVQLSLALEAA